MATGSRVVHVVDIPFTRGVREDVSQMVAPPGSLVTADNVEFDERGRLQKRNGIVAINLGVYTVRRIVDDGGAPIVCNERSVRRVTSNGGILPYGARTTGYVALDDLQIASVTSRTMLAGDPAAIARMVDIALSGANLLVAWVEYNDADTRWYLYATIRDITYSSTPLNAWRLYDFGTTAPEQHIRCLWFGSRAVIVYADATGANVQAYTILVNSASSVTLEGATNMVTDATSGLQHFGVDNTYDGTADGKVALAYWYNGTGIRFRALNFSGGVWSTTYGPLDRAVTVGGTTRSMSVVGAQDASDRIVAVLGEDANMWAASSDYQCSTSPYLTSSVGSGQQWVAIGRRDATYHTILAGENTLATPRGTCGVSRLTRSSGAITGRTGSALHTTASVPTVDANGLAVWMMRHYDGVQSGYSMVACDIDTTYGSGPLMRPQFSAGAGRAVAETADTCPTMSRLVIAGTAWYWATILATDGAQQSSQVALYKGAINAADRYCPAQLGDVLVLGGGTPLVLDGYHVADMGFEHYPYQTLLDAAANTTGGTMSQGTYFYRFTFEWVDSTGRRHQSAPTPACEINMSGGAYAGNTNSVDWELRPLPLSRKHFPFGAAAADVRHPVRIVVWRTTAGGTIYYRRNDDTRAFVGAASWVDTLDDGSASLTAQEILYTQRGELSHGPTPPTLALAGWGDRLSGIDAERGNRLWFSKTVQAGEFPQYSEALSLTIPSAGTLRALASLDGKLYAFGDGGIFMVYGDGPDNAGGGAPFPPAVQISGQHSCADQRHVVVGADGVYFFGTWKGGKSVFLLRRGDSQVQEIGHHIRSTIAAYPYCLGMIWQRRKGRLEVLLGDADPTPTHGRVALYHADVVDEAGVGAWTFTRVVDDDGNSLTPAFAVIGTSLGYSTVARGADVFHQPETGFADTGLTGSEPVTVIETCDIRPNGLQGESLINAAAMLVEWRADTSVRWAASYDSGLTFEDGRYFSAESLAVGQPLSLYWQPATAKLPRSSVRYRIQIVETEASLSAENLRYLGISLEVAPVGALARPPLTLERGKDEPDA